MGDRQAGLSGTSIFDCPSGCIEKDYLALGDGGANSVNITIIIIHLNMIMMGPGNLTF